MNSRLEYAKLILQKVSFDRQLFKKELLKARKFLKDTEWKDLIQWAKLNFAYLAVDEILMQIN
ncbi:MAG: hypothetical protein KatS3mg034_0102 [Vicingaceae bacterium]|jgi:hypothetical protein|nr:MAG: hypothetical protein KatS3mg034_0102 [Vicingaceae bacterium]